MGEVYRRKIGAVELTALQDGRARWAPRDILRPEVEADFAPYQHLIDEDGTTELSMTVYLLESQGVRVLADSGIADQPMGRHDMDEHSQLPILLDQEGSTPPRSTSSCTRTCTSITSAGTHDRRATAGRRCSRTRST